MTDPRIGGPQRRSLAVARRLREHDVETEFLLPDGDDEFVSRARSEGFDVHRPGLSRIQPPKRVLANAGYVLQYPLAVWRIERVVQQRSIDIVHANMSLNFDAAVGAWQSDAALVWHFNDVMVPWPLNRIAATAGATIADELVVASGGVADHYFANSGSDPNRIYAPVDVRKFDPDEMGESGLRRELGIGEETVIVGSVGNVNPIKGYEYLLRAAGQVEENTDRTVAVLLAGAVLDSQSKYVERLQRIREDLDLEDTVRFLGHRSDVGELLLEFDVFALSSIAEACPMAVLEAMAMRKPVVATDVGGVPEQIDDGETGWLVPPRDPASLARAITEALEHPEEGRRRGKKARQNVIETFSLDRCVQRHIHVYRKALDQ